MVIVGDDPHAISDLLHYLGEHFEMKDLGSFNYFLGIEVSMSSAGYSLSQTKYTSDIPFEDATLYRKLVGSLIYLRVTRLDIAYVVHIVSQFMVSPRIIHFTIVLRILRYVKEFLGHDLQFSSQSSLVLSGYSDAD
ncbi:uncharacterized mitochondrial protein AtMg00810-like [Benincasa hispida]|uniref:uncharacterized mitochondrial protein AtMg00810-like n=1 Tax=Benincasa hispida TaxID=102211 RepID=UPI0018FF168A|nr:uncharacterized mitochondrial protein AtMg00810-like [Benincasa hispida]